MDSRPYINSKECSRKNPAVYLLGLQKHAFRFPCIVILTILGKTSYTLTQIVEACFCVFRYLQLGWFQPSKIICECFNVEGFDYVRLQYTFPIDLLDNILFCRSLSITKITNKRVGVEQPYNSLFLFANQLTTLQVFMQSHDVQISATSQQFEPLSLMIPSFQEMSLGTRLLHCYCDQFIV